MMGISAGPDMVQDGLVLSLNANDRLSYISGSTTWNDVSGQGNNGTLTNGPTFNSANGGSIVFDGTNDYVIHSSLDLGTVCSWGVWVNYVRVANSNEAFVVLGANLPNRYNLFYDFPTKNFYVGTGDVFRTLQYSTGLNTNTWYNIVHTRNENTVTVYINGVNIGIMTGTSSFPSLFRTIGSEGTGAYFSNIRVSGVCYYNRTLSAQEVLQNYNALKSRFNL
jgi:hypothetical protein